MKNMNFKKIGIFIVFLVIFFDSGSLVAGKDEDFFNQQLSNVEKQYDKKACFNVAESYLFGKGITLDYKNAHFYFEMTWEFGERNPDILKQMANLYKENNFDLLAKKWHVRFLEFEDVSKVNAHDFYQVALWYFNGNVFRKDIAKACEFFIKALDNGCTQAAGFIPFCLGYLSEFGLGDKEKDLKKAFDYYKTSAENYSVTDAMFRLGLFYWYGKGDVKKDEKQAKELISKASERGDVNARFFLQNLEG